MFELSDILVGIYKINDCSASIAIKNIPPEIIPLSQQTQNTQPTQMFNEVAEVIAQDIVTETPSSDLENDEIPPATESTQIETNNLENDVVMN